MKICLFDPGFKSLNLGDLVIQEAVKREIANIFENYEIISIPTHSYPTQKDINSALSCSLILVGGSNLIDSTMNEYKQWRVSLRQKIQLGRAVLLGVGWRKYQDAPNLYSKISLKAVLSNKLLHSVRDDYTKMQLEKAGIKNVINTGCPTMWPLASIKSDQIPSKKSENVLVMLTDYKKEPELDKKLLELVLAKYKKVFVWPQGGGDMNYILSLISEMRLSVGILGAARQDFSDIAADTRFPFIIINRSIGAFEELLNSEVAFDYIGTRLHGGIKCLIARKRTLILEIDNRAKEIALNTGLPTSQRADFSYMSQWIDGPSITKIKIDVDSINSWKSQFIEFGVKADLLSSQPKVA